MTPLLRLPPLLLPLCVFICGIAAAGSLGIFLPACLLSVALLPPLTLLLFRSRIPLFITICLTLFMTGNVMMRPILQKSPETARLLQENLNNPLLVEGIIVNRPEARDGGYRVAVRPEHIETTAGRGTELCITGLILLRIGKGGDRFATGDRIRFLARLKAPGNFGTAGEFNIERFYALKGVAATSFVKSDADVLTVRQGEESGFQRHFDRTAAEIGRFIMNRLPGVEGGVMKALLIGDLSDIPQQIKDQYSLTGVNHILSISGFHIGIIALALFQVWFALSRLIPVTLLYINFRRIALFASIPLVTYYMFLSGAAPATARSVLMLCLLAAGLMLERESDPINSLCLAAAVLLMINPANLYDISFQLSFLALWGLTVITPLLAQPFKSAAAGWRYNLLLFAAASTAAVTVTLLPVAYYFQQTSLTGIISNFFIVPLLGYGAVVTGFTALPFIWTAPTIAAWLLKIAGALTTASNEIISMLAKVPALPVFIPTDTEIYLFLIAMLLITVIRNHLTKSAVMVALPLIITMLHQLPAEKRDFALRIDFLSVGQGESTLITFDDGRKMLIDGGGALYDSGWDIGRQLLLPTLRKMGVKRIDYLVLTHAHPDHLQGLKTVAETLPVGEFWESGLNSGEEYRKLKAILRLHGVPAKILSNNSPAIDISATRIKCLHPLNRKMSARDMNETSLILRLDSAAFSALFTGDIGFETEARLIGEKSNLRATLLKVPHHGSRYSTGPDFLDAVSPEIALISAGVNNSFGLPAPETVEQLAAKRIRIYRTDLDGTISIELPKNGKDLVISAFKRQIH